MKSFESGMKTIARGGLLLMVSFLAASFGSKIKPKVSTETSPIKVVCIDAGHGGKDPGCHGDKIQEKDVALAVALKLGAYIEKNFPNIKVIYTRKTDVFVELNERAAIANRNNADLFICVHCNSACVRDKKTKKDICNEEAHGAETYTMGLHKTAGNLDVAKRENSAIEMESDYQTTYDGFDPNSDEAYIIMTMVQNANMDQSVNFAQLLQDQFRTKAGRKDKGVNQAGFLVLWKTSMPSVLIETGFLTNPEEERFLGSTKGQDYMACSIFCAFRHWKDKMEGSKDSTYTDDLENMAAYKPGTDDTAGLRKPQNGIRGTNPTKKDTLVNVTPPIKKDTLVVKPVVKDTTAKPVESGLVFRVQIISSDKKLPKDDKRIKDLTDVIEYLMNGSYKYAVGSYPTVAQAAQRQSEMRKAGYDGAFVVTFKDGKRIK